MVNGYFVHYLAPSAIPKGDKHVIFVLDKSGSMRGHKMDQLKSAMKEILGNMPKTDRTNILLFSDSVGGSM